MAKQLLIKSKVAAWILTATVNRLLYSGTFSNGVWTATNCSLTSGQTDPNAGSEAFTVTASGSNATLLQSVTLDNGLLNRVFSIYIKRKTGSGNISLTADGATYEVVSITGNWNRYDVTAQVDSSTISVGLKIATSGDEVYVAFAQYEDGAFPTDYVEVAAGNPYTVTQITDGDYPANTTRGCTYMSGRFFVMTPTGEIYHSDLDNGFSWNALNFIQSQNDPSDGVFLSKIGNYVVALKQWATEFFYDAANPNGSILSPVQNAAFQIGCASDSSVQEVDGGLVFMGQTKSGFGRSINTLIGTNLTRISTTNVEKIIDRDDLSTVYSWSARIESHSLYGLTLVTTGVTLVYDFSTQQWSFFTYLESSGSAKTITAITAAGVATSTAHGFSDGDIVYLSSTNSDFNGWHVAADVTANTFTVQATGTAFSGSGSAQKYDETYFPVVASVRAEGKQYMQDATSGKLYEFSQEVYVDDVGAIAARVRTPKLDGGSADQKFMSEAELIGDKITSTAVLRYSDDDFVTYSSVRPVDLSVSRSRIRRLGNYSRRSFEILHVGDALFRMEALEIS